jgi:hypothetical protein
MKVGDGVLSRESLISPRSVEVLLEMIEPGVLTGVDRGPRILHYVAYRCLRV